jgi:hypothetical protein
MRTQEIQIVGMGHKAGKVGKVQTVSTRSSTKTQHLGYLSRDLPRNHAANVGLSLKFSLHASVSFSA